MRVTSSFLNKRCHAHPYLKGKLGADWVDKILTAKNWVYRGKEASDQINILGDDGVPIDYHLTFWKAEMIDFVLMQQDAFDKIDAQCPLPRQKYMMDLVMEGVNWPYHFDTFDEVAPYFKRVINTLKQMNYAVFNSSDYTKYESEFRAILNERRAN